MSLVSPMPADHPLAESQWQDNKADLQSWDLRLECMLGGNPRNADTASYGTSNGLCHRTYRRCSDKPVTLHSALNSQAKPTPQNTHTASFLYQWATRTNSRRSDFIMWD